MISRYRSASITSLAVKKVCAVAAVGRVSRSILSARALSVVVDLRSDTVTSPTRVMIEQALTAKTGDDVFSEDPTVLELEEYSANLFGKEKGLYVPTGTMANLIAVLAHCHGRAAEIIVGANSHICLYEGGGVANLGGVHSRQLPEDPVTAELSFHSINDAFRLDNDDHFPKTELVCIENSHNILGGVALSQDYVDALGNLAHSDLNVKLHMDGARIFNAAISQDIPVKRMCQHVDSVSFCLSKGLGAPLGSVLVGEKDFILKAKRARKRCGGGMRQAGVVAAMGLYALQNNVKRLRDDHKLAIRFASELKRNNFRLIRNGKVDTNLVFFALPENCLVTKDQLCERLEKEYNVKIGGGYGSGGEMFRAAFHMDVDEEGADRAAEAIISLAR